MFDGRLLIEQEFDLCFRAQTDIIPNFDKFEGFWPSALLPTTVTAIVDSQSGRVTERQLLL